MSDSLLIAPRIPPHANTPKLDARYLPRDSAAHQGGGRRSRLTAAPAIALLVGAAIGILASWLAGVF